MRLRCWCVDQILTSELFDLPTARPAEFDEALKRRTELLGKSRLTKADREELKQLEARLDQLPPGWEQRGRSQVDGPGAGHERTAEKIPGPGQMIRIHRPDKPPAVLLAPRRRRMRQVVPAI